MTCTFSPIFQINSGFERNGGVFGGEPNDSAVWEISEDWGSLVLADGLLADVEDGPIGVRPAHDGGQNRDCRPVARDVAGLGVILAGEDASAGLNFGDPGHVGCELIGARASRRDDPAFAIPRLRQGRASASSLPIAAVTAARFSAGSAIIKVWPS